MVRLLALYAHHRMDVVVLGLQDPMHENDVLDIAIIKNLSCNWNLYHAGPEFWSLPCRTYQTEPYKDCLEGVWRNFKELKSSLRNLKWRHRCSPWRFECSCKEGIKSKQVGVKCAEQTILPVATEHYLVYLGEKQTMEQVFWGPSLVLENWN